MPNDAPSGTTWTLRPAAPQDLDALAALYAAAVRETGPSFYTPDQVRVWARAAELPRFRDWVLAPETVVAEDETGPVGFAGLSEAGHVTALYVRPDRQRRGLGTVLLGEVLKRAEARGLERLTTEASHFSRPLFARFGFRVVEVETVERGGVEIDRFVMVRVGDPGEGGAGEPGR